jgi:hypothetical protein
MYESSWNTFPSALLVTLDGTLKTVFSVTNEWRVRPAGTLLFSSNSSAVRYLASAGFKIFAEDSSSLVSIQTYYFALEPRLLGILPLPHPHFMPIFEGYLTGNRIKSA